MQDNPRAEILKAMIPDSDDSDRWVGVQAIMREIEAIEPGACERMAAGLQLSRLRHAARKSGGIVDGCA